MKFLFLLISLFSIFALASLTPRPTPDDLGGLYKFDLLTPTGDIIFRNSLIWESQQIDNLSYPRPLKCALNVTKVLSLSHLNYSGESVGALLQSVVNGQGRYIKLPKEKYGIIEKLNSFLYNGNIPVGTVVGGCLYSDCFSGQQGQRHAALVAEIGSDGVLYVIHNNWYRPNNEGGVWKPFMVSKYFLNLGLIRQWMPTPWLKLIKDQNTGKIIDVISMMPRIDDLDPFQYNVSLVVPKEIHDEIINGKGRSTSGASSFKPNSINTNDFGIESYNSDIFDIDDIDAL